MQYTPFTLTFIIVNGAMDHAVCKP